MKLLRLDRQILEALRTQNAPLSIYQIIDGVFEDCDIRKRKYKSVWLRLKYLCKHRVLLRTTGRPVLWAINPKPRETLVYYKISCPKCNTERTVSNEQVIAYCANRECYRPNGERTRFIVDEERAIDILTF